MDGESADFSDVVNPSQQLEEDYSTSDHQC